MRAKAIIAASLITLLATAARADALDLQPVGSTFDHPLYMTSPPGDPRLFVVERTGQVVVLHDGLQTQFLDIHTQVTTDIERGLLSMAFDPNYATNGLVYVFYTSDGVDSSGPLGEARPSCLHR